jgi:hypothetical protein
MPGKPFSVAAAAEPFVTSRAWPRSAQNSRAGFFSARIVVSRLVVRLVFGNQGKEKQEYSESQEEPADSDEEHERNGLRPEQTKRFHQQSQNQKNS